MVLQVNYSREISDLSSNQQSGDLPNCTVKIAYQLSGNAIHDLFDYGNALPERFFSSES